RSAHLPATAPPDPSAGRAATRAARRTARARSRTRARASASAAPAARAAGPACRSYRCVSRRDRARLGRLEHTPAALERRAVLAAHALDELLPVEDSHALAIHCTHAIAQRRIPGELGERACELVRRARRHEQRAAVR